MTGKQPEVWQPIRGWPYEISSAGRVRSMPRTFVDAGGRRRRVRGRVLILSTPTGPRAGGGGPRCTLTDGARRRTFHPHRHLAVS